VKTKATDKRENKIQAATQNTITTGYIYFDFIKMYLNCIGY